MRVLPIHDAQFTSMKIVPLLDGAIELALDFNLHPDEALEELARLGIAGRSIRLNFNKCWQVASNFVGICTKPETIDGWKILEKSELLKTLKSYGFATSDEVQHYRIDFSGGSSLDILTQEASIEELGPPFGTKK